VEVPHYAGTVGDEQSVQVVIAKFKELGLQTTVQEFQVLVPEPVVNSSLVLFGVANYSASLREPALSEDPFSSTRYLW